MASLQGGGAGGGVPKPPMDPLEELKQMLTAAGVGSNAPVGSSSDYLKAAQQAYAPQLGYLDQAAAGAKANAANAGKSVDQIFNALSKSILDSGIGVTNSYNSGINDVNSAYNSAINASNQRFSQSNQESANILQRLGIQEAAPNVLGKSNEMRALLDGIMQANGLANSNYLRQGKQSAQTFIREQGNTAKVQGAEARSGISRQLQAALDALASKRADLGTQINQSALSMQSDAQKAQSSNWTDIWDRMFKTKSLENDMANQKAQLDLKSLTAGNQNKMDPLGEVQRLASQLYPNSQAASNAMRVVTEAATQAVGPDGKLSMKQLMDKITENLMKANGRIGDYAELQRLAALYMKQMG